jgi:hypothetical protein
MSSAVVSTPAALGRPFVFDDANAEVCPSSAAHKKPAMQESAVDRIIHSTIKNQQSKMLANITPASQLNIRSAREMVSSGIPAIDALTGGLPRGCLTEICGPASSGRTTMLLAALAAATSRGEFCALVDASDALDPQSAAAAGVELDRLLWVRCGEDPPQKSQPKTGPISHAPFAREACPEPVEWVGSREVDIREVKKGFQATFDFDRAGLRGNGFKENGSRQSDRRLEQVLRATDLLLESGGFGLIVLDLSDLPPQSARRIPLTTWFRYRRAIEHTPTILLAIEQHPIAGSCSSLLLQLESSDPMSACADGSDALTHAHLLTGLEINAELIRSRLDRKPARSIAFATKTAWAG